MPFFVVFEINPSLVDGWRGDVLWEKLGEQFLQLHNADYGCAKIAKDDLGKRIFALAIGPDDPRDFVSIQNYNSARRCSSRWYCAL
jgi:hypothetical protein